MPGRVFLTSPPEALAEALGTSPAPIADEPPRRNIAPGQEVIAYTAEGLSRMRWGIIPVGRVNARGRPVMETIINARSETVFDKTAFDGVGLAVLPVNGWYEWTGEKRRKTAWRIMPTSGEFLFFAAITDCKSVYTGSIPVLASNKNKGLAGRCFKNAYPCFKILFPFCFCLHAISAFPGPSWPVPFARLRRRKGSPCRPLCGR